MFGHKTLEIKRSDTSNNEGKVLLLCERCHRSRRTTSGNQMKRAFFKRMSVRTWIELNLIHLITNL